MPTSSTPFDYDGVVVAGGRSSRLGGTPKATLRREDGASLVGLTVEAVRAHGTVVVVGPRELDLPHGVLRAREDPPFSGPAAAVAAGLERLRAASASGRRAGWTAVLACDMPRVGRAVAALAHGAAGVDRSVDGVMAVSEDGRHENLAVMVRTPALERVFAGEDPRDRSVRSFWKHLSWHLVHVPPHSTRDVDTWEDVNEFDLY